MDIVTFNSLVAAYMNRPVDYFSVNGVDLLLRAANNAKRFAQRTLDFELARCSVDVTVNLQTGGLLSTALLHGTNTAIDVHKIERGWVQYGTGSTAYRPAEVISRQRYSKRLESAWESNVFDPVRQPTPTVTVVGNLPSIIRQGETIYVWPNDSSLFGSATTTGVALDVLKWMPDYDIDDAITLTGSTTPASSGSYAKIGVYAYKPVWFSATRGLYVWYNDVSLRWQISTQVGATAGTSYWKLSSSTTPIGSYTAVTYTGTPVLTMVSGVIGTEYTDFFLDHCFDWMQWKVIQELNGYLKDGERVTVSAALMAQAWQTIVSWNESLCDGGNEDVTLD